MVPARSWRRPARRRAPAPTRRPRSAHRCERGSCADGNAISSRPDIPKIRYCADDAGLVSRWPGRLGFAGMKRLLTLVLLALCGGALLPAIPASAAPTSEDQLSWQLSPTGVTARFRGLSAVSHTVAWASGRAGTV